MKELILNLIFCYEPPGYEPSGRGYYYGGDDEEEIDAMIWSANYSDIIDFVKDHILPLFEYKLFTAYIILSCVCWVVAFGWDFLMNFWQKYLVSKPLPKVCNSDTIPGILNMIAFPVFVFCGLLFVSFLIVTFVIFGVICFLLSYWWQVLLGIVGAIILLLCFLSIKEWLTKK